MIDSSDDIQQIRKLAADWHTGWVARDANLLMSLYADEPVLMPQDQAAVIGKDAIRQLYESVLRDFAFESHSTVIEVDAAGDLGYIWSSYAVTATPNGGGTPIMSTCKSVFIVKRQHGGAWKIVRLIDNSDGGSSSVAA